MESIPSNIVPLQPPYMDPSEMSCDFDGVPSGMIQLHG